MEPESTIPIPDEVEKALAGLEGRVWETPHENQPTQAKKVPIQLWYLAHPMTGDDIFTFRNNKERALEVQRILWEAGIQVVNTWFSFSIIYGVGEGAEMKRYLNLDKAVIRVFGGIILTGHKLSSGMRIEFEFALENHLRIMNLINIPDEHIAALVKDYIT